MKPILVFGGIALLVAGAIAFRLYLWTALHPDAPLWMYLFDR